jgi:hypothetical protein
MVWGKRGRVREGSPSRRGSGGLAPGKIFANRRRKYAFSRPCLGSICLFHHFIFGTKMSINLPFSSKCIHEVDNICQIYLHCRLRTDYQWRIQEFCLRPSHLFPPSFLPSFLPLLSLPISFLCITLIRSSPSLSHTTPLLPSCVPNPLLSLPSFLSSPSL